MEVEVECLGVGLSEHEASEEGVAFRAFVVWVGSFATLRCESGHARARGVGEGGRHAQVAVGGVEAADGWVDDLGGGVVTRVNGGWGRARACMKIGSARETWGKCSSFV